MMKTAEINKAELKSQYPSLEDISAMLDRNERLLVDTLNWKGYDYKPKVEVSISYSDHEIFLKYYVTENYFKADMTESNQMVCEDSCVEFFVSPGDDGVYYNFEFNGIGTCLLGSGNDRTTSKRVDPVIISKIRRLSTAAESPVAERIGEFTWTITIAIPFEVFFRHKIDTLEGKTFRANFYKCGDKLSVPHYVTWNPIGTENPDYHQPGYFGVLKFI